MNGAVIEAGRPQALDVLPRQGRRRFDDFALRLGLVEAGPRRLGRLERLFSPAWLRTLFDLAPPGTGVTRVRFLAVGGDRTQVGQTRTHPMHELLEEQIVTAPAPDGTIVIDEPIVPPAMTLGVWLAADGDDTSTLAEHHGHITFVA